MMAAQQGDDDAQYLVGWMYETGTGVPKRKLKALSWYSLSAAQGNSDAKERVSLLSSAKHYENE
jgi:TPR repeat protein